MVNLQFITHNEAQTEALGAVIAKYVGPGFILLQGTLGTGKTTFTRYLANALQISEVVNSPTFVIMNEYVIPKQSFKLIHMDAYRLNNNEDLEMYEEAFNNNLNIIEWYENVLQIIDFNNALILQWNIIDDTTRVINLSGKGLLATQVIKFLQDNDLNAKC
ncbi:tRNA (adenosine(37)-N6)-threonylcarbamoyltransferase complex ATPase subunit type 1 TsaE [Spiroplasma endosymbiont of Agriotes lineatus]|uniref:tRNA (adenosine(37)-N6)-threonylcarbamoyltransferase complex ATPase subunit type 1 TsaE n=1 Tax=Spiroplasma endosymbiont of Agriotes lineatus TaxID=3077930 RepID=UPI0030D428AA